MKNDVLILGARPYDFTDEKTQRQVSGVSVWVLPLVNEEPDSVVGLLPVKYSLTQAQFALIAQKPLPARAEMFMTVNIATKKVAFDRFENVEAVDMAA
jgi:hypothetical protein